MPECSHCSGRGYTFALCDIRDAAGRRAEWRRLPCRTCEETGALSDETWERIEAGRAMREARIARLETQAEAAARLGLDLVTYSRREHGRDEA